MMIFSRIYLPKWSKTHFGDPGLFWAFWGGLFVASAGLGCLFHRFGSCTNQDDFLEEFVFQTAPKLVLVTLAPFGGDSVDGLGYEIVDENISADGLGHEIVDKSSSADGLGHEIDDKTNSADGLGHEIVDKTNSADGLGHEIVDKNSSADGYM